MELERTLFRVHERFLAVDGVKKSVSYCYKVCIVLVLATLPIFFYGNLRFMNTSPCLKPFIENNFVLNATAGVSMPPPPPANGGINQTDVANGTIGTNGTALNPGTSGLDQVPGKNETGDESQTAATNQSSESDQTTPNNSGANEAGDASQTTDSQPTTPTSNPETSQAGNSSQTSTTDQTGTPENGQTVEPLPSENGGQLNQTEGEAPAVVGQGKPQITRDDLVVIRIADLSNPNLNLSNPDDLSLFFELSGTYQIVLMDPTIRANHNFTQHNVTIDVSCYSGSFMSDFIMFLLGYENIMMNELIYTFEGFDRFVKNNVTGETWNFPDNQVRSITEKENIFSHISSRFFGIFKLLLGVFLVSNITAIYNKMTIICAPIFILAAYSLCSHPSQQQYERMNLYRAFPWIGMYMYTLNNNGRRKDRYMIFAFFCMIAIFYCLYLAALVFWNLLLFAKSYPKGLDENFYGFLALVEFLVLLFLRTRTTLKYFPQMSMLLILMFLYYVQYTPYGFYNMCLFIVNWCVLGLFAYFMLHFEIPALNWNPSYHYTPSIESPRMLYFPIFSLTWYHDIPQLWTMFFPVYGRSHFTSAELSMVDGNHTLLRTTLENASQGIRAQDDQGLGDGGNANNAGNPNVNFPFGPQQEMVNLPVQGGNAANEAAPARLNASSNSNLLAGANQGENQQNNESDYVLNISDDRPNNNTRLLNWRQNEENTQSQYRRIDDEA